MPFKGTAVLEDFALMINYDAFNFRLNIKTLRNASETIDNGFQRLLADRSRLGFARVFRLKYRCGFPESGFLAGLAFLDTVDLIARHFEPQSELGFQRGGIVFAQCSRFEQLVFVKLRD